MKIYKIMFRYWKILYKAIKYINYEVDASLLSLYYILLTLYENSILNQKHELFNPYKASLIRKASKPLDPINKYLFRIISISLNMFKF